MTAKNMWNRRVFLGMAASSMGSASLWQADLWSQALAQPDPSLESKLAQDPRRPQFHLLPARNWMNDPNGPIYWNGAYHMFFQYNPNGPTWGDMSWNHAISPDMLHWTHMPVAMTPTPDGPDSFGVFSGSAIAVGKRVYAVYTGTRHSGSDLATIRDGANNIQESQCLAWSDDPRLMNWTKDPQPIIARPPAGLDITGFRDPSAWKKDDWFYMTVGSGIAKVGGCVLLYRSKDLKNWEYLHQLTSGTWNGVVTSNPCDDGQMWECPDFFPLDGGYVLIYSTLGKVFWESGSLDDETMKFRSSQRGLLDLDAFYAPKTQKDATGRRILWGWVPERRPDAALLEAGWAGMMSLPRVLNLDKDGQLRMQVLPQLASLRSAPLVVSRSMNGGRTTLAHANGEVLVTGTAGEKLDLIVQLAPGDSIKVSYSPENHTFVADGKEIKLEPADIPKLHLFVDGSVVEMILSDRIGYTKRFYYTGATAPDIEIEVAGKHVRMSAWTIKATSANRLTTPATKA